MKRDAFLKGILGTMALAVIPSKALMEIKDKAENGYWYNELKKLYKEMGQYLISIMTPGTFYHSKNRRGNYEFDAFIKDNWDKYSEITIDYWGKEKQNKCTTICNEPYPSYGTLILLIARVSEKENKPVKDWAPERKAVHDKIRRFIREKVKQGEARYPYTKLNTFVSYRTGDNIRIGSIFEGDLDPYYIVDINEENEDLIALFADSL